MSKARTLADFISDGSEFADGTISVAEVSGAAPLASPTFTGNIDAGDNVRIRLGDDDDLQIYHDGYHSNIKESGAGSLLIDATNIYFRNAAGTKDYLDMVDGGAVTLKYNNDAKIATAADGVDITGDVGATTATITGKTTTDELDLNAIAATIADTAVDIFVYDTRKDSDGGAWRKRTQGTSWYNETLNTATRGSRKEFPAVAVITVDATSDYITIYDGDDPDMPMWMVFNSGGNRLIRYNTSFGGVSVVNGRMVVGNNATIGGLSIIDFVMDYGAHYNSSDTQVRKYDALANRNVSIVDGTVSSPFTTDTSSWLLNKVNNVAMTVLPNAPIDAATGLPVPTIAVATDGGYSIIKDDGTVVDGTCSQSLHNKVGKIKFTEDNRVAYLGFHYNLITRSRFWRIDDIISTDTVITTNVNEAQNSAEFYANANNIASNDKLLKVSVNPQDYGYAGYVEANENTFVAGNNEGVSLVDRNKTKPSDGMVSFLASSYQTGYQVGDIKLATLSDTDDTNVTGSELVTNGTFDSDISGWTDPESCMSYDSTNQRMQLDGSGSNKRVYQYLTGLTVGKRYVLSLTATGSANGYISTTTNSSGNLGGLGYSSAYSDTPLNISFTATQANLYLVLYVITTTAYFDNISVRLAEEDRSVNGNGLQVFGTVTKSAVATGADLVGYRGNGYLFQPQAGGLNLTNDFSITWWQKHNGGGIYEGWQIAENSTSGANAYDQVALSIMHQVSSSEYLIRGNGLSGFATGSNTTTTGSWQCVCFTKVGTTYSVYLNGVLTVSATESNITTPSNPYSLQLLRWQYGATVYSAGNSDFALFRTSATVPSPEQIKKIYEDEKVLFQENAKATLYGSSDAVTALAYDDSTNLLHVGTSAGRSVFQGLRRVDNTTTAVGAAISASNGLVADE